MSGSSGARRALFAFTMLSASVAVGEHVALRWLLNERDHDSAYTVSAERADRLVREQGYVDRGIIAYVEAEPQPHTRPLICLYAGAPKTDTFCTISTLEQKIVHSLGYQYVSVEGFLPLDRLPGTTPLYRVSRAPGDAADREHRFVLSSDELVRLRKEGWTYDGAKGYVYPSPLDPVPGHVHCPGTSGNSPSQSICGKMRLRRASDLAGRAAPPELADRDNGP